MNMNEEQNMIPETKIGATLAGLSELIEKNPDGNPDFIAKDLLKLEEMIVDNNQTMETTTQNISEELKTLMATVQIIKDKIKYFQVEAAKCKEKIQMNNSEIDKLKKQLEDNLEINRKLDEELKLKSVELKTKQLQKTQELNTLSQSNANEYKKQIERLNSELADINSNLQRVSNENRELRDKIKKDDVNIRKNISDITSENEELNQILENMDKAISDAYNLLNTLSQFATIKQGDYQTVLKEVRQILKIPEPTPPLSPPPLSPLSPPPPPPRRAIDVRPPNPPLKVGNLAPTLEKQLNRMPGLNGGTRKKHVKHKKRKHTKRQKK